jgi:hypothetical protein
LHDVVVAAVVGVRNLTVKPTPASDPTWDGTMRTGATSLPGTAPDTYTAVTGDTAHLTPAEESKLSHKISSFAP